MDIDVVVIGAGAAGLATAIFAARENPELRVTVFDAPRKPGAKILVSGGGRCNVTNAVVTAQDFNGGSSNVVRRVLEAFPADKAAAFFREIGVALHEEPGGKLFPDTNQARTVLEALLGEAERKGVRLLSGRRVAEVVKEGDRFRVVTPEGPVEAGRVVLATGGKSLPKSGSDGTGYLVAEKLGHSIVPVTPALVPLVLEGDFHASLSGVALPVEVTVRVEGKKPERIRGALLWTHFGVSGPAVLDASRHWERARLEARAVSVAASFLPGEDHPSAEGKLIALGKAQPRTHLRNALGSLLPGQLAAAVLDRLRIDGSTPMAHVTREDRRALVRSLLEWPLPVKDSRGYTYAEVTAGGVPLSEIDPRTFESRRCAGLYLVGEILDVDGRIGGFNFQWAWSTGWITGAALAKIR